MFTSKNILSVLYTLTIITLFLFALIINDAIRNDYMSTVESAKAFFCFALAIGLTAVLYRMVENEELEVAYPRTIVVCGWADSQLPRNIVPRFAAIITEVELNTPAYNAVKYHPKYIDRTGLVYFEYNKN